jgi:thiamine-phosphate pyrophosphorylase
MRKEDIFFSFLFSFLLVVSCNQTQGDSNMSAITRLTAPFSCLHFPKERLVCSLSLYLIANRPSFQNEQLFFSKIQEAVRGGVSCVQLRDHKSDYPTSLKIAGRLKEMLNKVPLFINTLESIKIAQSVDAEGVYLEEGISHFEARSLLGEKAIIGVPVKTIADVIAAAQTNAIDYLSVKVSRSTKTCSKNDLLWGIEGLRKIRLLSPHRIIAVGGLNLDCVEPIYRDLRYDDGVAMAGGLMAEEDPYLTAQKIQGIREKVRRQL